MSDLRDRIAKVLLPDLEYASAYNPGEDPQVWAHRLADAVIAELGLEPQAHYDPGVAYHRWVTDWGAATMSDPFCAHRWDSSNLGNPGQCQCQQWRGHFGPHRCCCGATIRYVTDWKADDE